MHIVLCTQVVIIFSPPASAERSLGMMLVSYGIAIGGFKMSQVAASLVDNTHTHTHTHTHREKNKLDVHMHAYYARAAKRDEQS